MSVYTSDTHNITIGLWNANSLQATSVSEVLSHCQQYTILFITETWVLPPSLLNVGWHEFHTYGKPVLDTQNRRTRGSQGIVALINPNCPLPVNHLIINSEYILSLQLGQLRISCFYLPPSLSLSQAMAALDTVPLNANTILCGDFNARLSTLTGDTAANTRGTQFKSWLQDRSLQVLNASMAYGIPTFRRMMNGVEHNSIIDLFLINDSTVLQNPDLQIHSDLTMGSDHCLCSLTFDLVVSPVSSMNEPQAVLPPRRTWNLSKLKEPEIDELYCDHFEKNTQYLVDSLARHFTVTQHVRPEAAKPDLDVINGQLCEAIYTALDSSVGSKPKKAPHHKKYWTDEIQQAAKTRAKRYKEWRQNLGFDKLVSWTKYLVANKTYRRLILVAKRLSWRDYCNSLEKDFTKAVSQVKFLKRKREQSGTYSHPDGPQTAATTMATHLAKVYDGQYLTDNHEDRSLDFISNEIPFMDSTFNFDPTLFAPFHVVSTIECLPRRKAPGIDHLRAEMLIPIKERLSVILSMIFKLCWTWSCVPIFWRHAQVFPIHKKGDPTDPGNFRPISLTSILRKLLEMILQRSVKHYSPPLDVAQGGFRTKRSALDQALCLHDLINEHQIKHNYRFPVVAFLDIKSAYDTVDRNIVWKALRLARMPLPLLGLLQTLFDDVEISVLIGNHVSQSFTTQTGFLQGSVLSPLLYSIYINGLPGALRAFATSLTTTVTPSASDSTASPAPVAINSLLFADDVAIFGTKKEVKQMLDAAAAHSYQLGYRWNPSKCAILNQPLGLNSQGDPIVPLKLYNVVLPTVTDFVYLGVPFIKSGISGKLLAEQRARGTMAAMSTLHKMGAHRSGFPLLLNSKLYRTFIRPKFEYGLAITKFTKADVAVLEKLQDKCLRLMVGGHPTSSTAVLKIMTNLPSVAWRIDVLITKYCLRIPYLPPNCLLLLLQQSLGEASLLNSYLKRNRLYQSLPVPNPTSSADLKSFFEQDRQVLFDSFRSTNNDKHKLAKAYRPLLGFDPILFLPATRTDRSRLIRWRMDWLPGKPHDCVCDSDHTSRRHFTKYECAAIPTYIWDSLPSAPPGVHPICNAINMLPTQVSSYGSYWPTLLLLLWYVEKCVSPSGYFPEDPDPGAMWRESCCVVAETTSE